ncbi:VanZ family protein [Lysobacter solisilvae (ex Woo and Kim 2020)]|uniref:VanZ family protein n=1 Tax=Agrilutibacter terrestris TaxID=2865112 RepID=A0A7H0G0I4_9GAMM|nr:VanZ family protein [Lysobacter terrestris]QNP41800.1 VanZ family protein [Lysobacter terrestris]
MNASPARALRGFKRPGLWLGLWGLAIATVVAASLMPPPAMAVPRNFDKVEHLLGYAALSAFAVQLFAQRSMQLRAAAGLVLLGIALEFAQALLTTTRMADPADALANALGVALGFALSYTGAARWLERFDRRLP